MLKLTIEEKSILQWLLFANLNRININEETKEMLATRSQDYKEAVRKLGSNKNEVYTLKDLFNMMASVMSYYEKTTRPLIEKGKTIEDLKQFDFCQMLNDLYVKIKKESDRMKKRLA